MIAKLKQIEFLGEEIAEAVDSWESQGFEVDLFGDLFAVYESKIFVSVKFNVAKVHITLSCGEHSTLRLNDGFNSMDTENAPQKIIDIINDYLERGLNAVYTKGGDTA